MSKSLLNLARTVESAANATRSTFRILSGGLFPEQGLDAGSTFSSDRTIDVKRLDHTLDAYKRLLPCEILKLITEKVSNADGVVVTRADMHVPMDPAFMKGRKELMPSDMQDGGAFFDSLVATSLAYAALKKGIPLLYTEGEISHLIRLFGGEVSDMQGKGMYSRDMSLLKTVHPLSAQYEKLFIDPERRNISVTPVRPWLQETLPSGDVIRVLGHTADKKLAIISCNNQPDGFCIATNAHLPEDVQNLHVAAFREAVKSGRTAPIKDDKCFNPTILEIIHSRTLPPQTYLNAVLRPESALSMGGVVVS